MMFMPIVDEARKILDVAGPISRTLYAQLLQFDGVERIAAELGYTVHFDPRVPMIMFRREKPHPNLPYDIKHRFDVIPRRPYWLEESGFVEVSGPLLNKYPNQLEREVIEVLEEHNRGEIRLDVSYYRSELGHDVVRWHGEVTSVEQLNDLLRNPPQA